MGEKKFLESIEDGELDIAVYARSWEEGDNVTVTCDLLFAMEQAVGVLNEQRAEIERLTRIAEYQQNCNTERYRIIQEKDKTIAEQKTEIAQLKKEKERWKDREKSFVNYFEKAKKEITEMRKKYDSQQAREATIDEFVLNFRKEIERLYLNEVDIFVKATMTKVAQEMKSKKK